MKDKNYIQFSRDEDNFFALIRQRKSAFILLCVIAMRARRKVLLDNIGLGEAFIGDFEKWLSTEQQYRGDKKLLEKLKIATFNPTPKGTIAKLLPNPFFDINIDEPNRLPNRHPTVKQRTPNGHPTTKEECKNVRMKEGVHSKKNVHTHSEMCVIGYGETKAILICQEEHRKLCQIYGRRPVNKKIKEMEAFMLSKGVEYKNHYFTLVSFILRDTSSGKLVLSEDGFFPSDFDSQEDFLARINQLK